MEKVMVWEEAAALALDKYKDKIEITTMEDVKVSMLKGFAYSRRMKVYTKMEEARLIEYNKKK